jgi:hypothetical protein
MMGSSGLVEAAAAYSRQSRPNANHQRARNRRMQEIRRAGLRRQGGAAKNKAVGAV